LRAIFVFLNNKITYNSKTTRQVVMQFYKVMYISWFYKWNKRGRV